MIDWYPHIIWLMVYLPLWKNMSSSVGMMNQIPNWMESHNPFHGSTHHQPVMV